ncbi:hypothetical protein MBLNU230_g2044t1 [Neophaeotheca triangularis]
MAAWYHPDPFTETHQANAYNGIRAPEHGFARTQPREEPFKTPHRHGGWQQGGRKLPNQRSKKYWARPLDGKRRGYLGRLADGLTNQGADVFVVSNVDRRTFHRDLPHRAYWSNWTERDPRFDPNWGYVFEDPDWYGNVGLKTTGFADRYRQGKLYNFRTRKYEQLTKGNFAGFWSDAWYADNCNRGDGQMPMCWRDAWGNWVSRVPNSAGLFAGGRPV